MSSPLLCTLNITVKPGTAEELRNRPWLRLNQVIRLLCMVSMLGQESAFLPRLHWLLVPIQGHASGPSITLAKSLNTQYSFHHSSSLCSGMSAIFRAVLKGFAILRKILLPSGQCPDAPTIYPPKPPTGGNEKCFERLHHSKTDLASRSANVPPSCLKERNSANGYVIML